jgi:hypothetical protein
LPAIANGGPTSRTSGCFDEPLFDLTAWFSSAELAFGEAFEIGIP